MPVEHDGEPGVSRERLTGADAAAYGRRARRRRARPPRVRVCAIR
jgi:hypothetical protein